VTAAPQDNTTRDPAAHRRALVIGVTGHRNIDPQDPRLQETVAHELERLRRTAVEPHTLVLSCLAEGADRLVARLGLDYLGARLVATLPMQPEDYRQDFESTESLQEFDELLAAAAGVLVLANDNAPPGGYRGTARTRRYACAGAYIVEHCDVLIALWDGEPARGIGGTGQLVDWMLAGEVPSEFSCRANGDEPIPITGPGRVVHIDPATRTVVYLGG
jgi:hypothetical protein